MQTTLDRRRTNDAPRAVLIWGAIAAGVATLLSTLYFVVRDYSPVPFMDQWDVVDADTLLDRLFQQHNEHRIIVPRLMFLVDVLLFRGSNAFLFVVSILTQLIHAWLFVRILATTGRFSRGELLAAGGLSLVALLNLSQYENFIWGFQVQFVGVFAAATAAFHFTARLAPTASPPVRHTAPLIMAAIASYAVATAMMSNGALAAIPLVLMTLYLGFGFRRLAAVAVPALLIMALFLLTFERPEHHPDPAAAKAVPTLLYIFSYLGGPVAAALESVGWIGSPDRLPAARIAGALGLAVAGVLAILALPARRSVAAPAIAALLAVVAFSAGTAAVTGLGRSAFDPWQAVSSRYGTPASIFWLAVALLGWVLARRERADTGILRLRLAPAIPTALPLVAIAIMGLSQIGFLKDGPRWRPQKDLAGLAILMGVDDPEALRTVYPWPELIRTQVSRLRSDDLSVFGVGWGDRLGRRIGSGEVDAARCDGAIQATGAYQTAEGAPQTGPAFRIEGWTTGRADILPEHLLAVGRDGEVIGLAVVGNGAGRPAPTRPDGSPAVRAAGYVRGAPGETVRVLAPLDGNLYCQVGEAFTLPAETVSLAMAAGFPPAELSGEDVQGIWAENGQGPSAEPLPFAARIVGSWAGNDAHTGALRWRVVPPSGAWLLIPYATGPDTAGQSIRVRLAGQTQDLARLDPTPSGAWRVWNVTVPTPDGAASTAEIEIIAEDTGAGWGQWLSVAAPRVVSPPR